MNASPGTKLIIIDGNSLINRAYYAIQRPMITKEGLYTHAVYGFLNMLKKIRDDYTPDYLVIAFDRKAPTFRHIEYSEYKAQRKGMPPELAMQLPLLKEVLTAMRVKMLELDGYEADDLIGTIVKRGEAAGLEPFVITGDRDALQLASDKTKILITKKGISEFELYDEAEIHKVYGFSPEQFIDYKGLRGDPSDNIPGLPGVGEKTAQKLILEFGSVEGLLANTEKIDNAKLRLKIEENAQLARMSRRLAQIDTNVPIETDFSEYREEEADAATLSELFHKLEFKSMLKKFTTKEHSAADAFALVTSPPRGKVTSQQHPQVVLVETEEQLKTVLMAIEPGSLLAVKVFGNRSHIEVPKIDGVSLLGEAGSYFVSGQISDLCGILRAFFCTRKIRLAGHLLQDDYYSLLCQADREDYLITAFDSAIAGYLLKPDQSKYELSTLCDDYLQRPFLAQEAFLSNGGQLGFLETEAVSFETGYAQFGAQWCAAVLDLFPVMMDELSQNELLTLYQDIELPLIFVLTSMEHCGFSVDRQELLSAGERLTKRIALISLEIYDLAGEEFNINSPKQLGEILFEKLGLPSGKKTKTGFSTNAEILEKLRDSHDIVDKILEFRTLSKLNGTYVEGLLPLIHKDGKIHAHFQQTVAATGRISCTEPNLQNIPIKQELGRQLRKAFIPENENFVLVGADYSQIELRVLAHMSADPGLIEAFSKGADIHRATAAKVFGVSEEEVTDLQRSNAKAVNFGVIYGMSGFGLSEELGITRKAAEEYIAAYFLRYGKVKEFMEEQVRFCREQGYVKTLFGRKRPIREIKASNYMVRQAAERLAMNSPIQGTAADIIKLAMLRCHEELVKRKLKSTLILQVHDELVIQTAIDEQKEVEELLAKTMEDAVALSVHLSVSLHTGENWYALK